MIDGIINETKDSRLIKSALPNTYADFKALVEGSGLPIDLLINLAGWLQTPTWLNKANLLSDATAAKYFESPVGTESVDQVLSLLADKGFKLLASFTAAGTVTFTVPVGVTRIFSLQIGGGASGGAASYNISGQTTRYNSASGGTSGVVKTAFADVTPGEIISGVVGAGGAAVSATTASSAGNSGGTTSFNGITTSGGAGGYAVAYSLWNSGVGCAQGAMLDGAQGSEFGMSFVNAQTPYFFARVRTYVSTLNDVNLKYIESMIRQIVAYQNALKTHVAAGGSGYITRNDSGIYLSESQSAITFSDSKTATSGAAISTTTNAGATAVSGSDPGCGGGAAVANGGVAMSAAGCDGAIFVFGVSA